MVTQMDKEAAVRAARSHRFWFGSRKKSGELVKVQVWLTVNDGRVEFLTGMDSLKVKRTKRNPRVTCFLGAENGPALEGNAEITTDAAVMQRIYRAYWKTHPVMMLVLGPVLKRRMKDGRQGAVLIRLDDPNPLAGVTDPAV